MHINIDHVIADRDKIEQILTRIANKLNSDFMGQEIVVMPVMCGAMIFASDLVRRLTMPLTIECIKVSSYGSGTVSGELSMELDTKADLTGKKILVIDDVIDSGNTLIYLKELFLSRGAETVKLCAMLDKPSRRTADVNADYVGMEIPDEFVVGFGLDFDGKYRNLPYVGVLKTLE